MTNLHSIKTLVASLKREEVKSLLKFLRYYQDASDDSKGKAIQLVEAVLSDPDCNSRDIQLALYGSENYFAFNKLLNRTRDKIYEVLLFDQNLSKPLYSDRNRAIFDIRKKLVQSEMLYARQITNDLESFQNKIISKAKSYEIYDSLIEALQAKQRFLGFRFGKKAFEKIESDISFYEECRKAISSARSLFTSIGSKINQSAKPAEYREELIESIRTLENYFVKTNSPTVEFFLQYLRIELSHINHEYKEAEEMLNQLLNIVLKNKSVYTRTRHGDVLINLSNNELFLGDYHSAIENAVMAREFYEKNSVTYDVALETEFFARFYNRELLASEKIIEQLYNSSRNGNVPFLRSKRTYLYACIMTIQGNFAKSNSLMREYKEIDKDKEGWNLSRRILTIINRIEEKDFENVDLKVLSLQKFIKRIVKNRNVRKRDIIILRILLKLINERFDFKKVYLLRRKYFDLLEGSSDEYGWMVKSPELILFNNWFKGKFDNKGSAVI